MKCIKITILLLGLLLVGCGTHPSKKMSEFIEMFPIGTKESYFTRVLEGEELVYSDTNISVYKLVASTYNYIHHRRSDFRFFYFHNGILKQIDKGKRAADLRIEVNRK